MYAIGGETGHTTETIYATTFLHAYVPILPIKNTNYESSYWSSSIKFEKILEYISY